MIWWNCTLLALWNVIIQIAETQNRKKDDQIVVKYREAIYVLRNVTKLWALSRI